MSDAINFKEFMEKENFYGALKILYSVKHPALQKIFPRLRENDVNSELRMTFIVGDDEIGTLSHYIEDLRAKILKHIMQSLLLFCFLLLLLMASIGLMVAISPLFFCMTIIVAVFLISSWYGIYIVFILIKQELTSPYYGFFESYSKLHQL